MLLHLGHSLGRPLLARMRPYSRQAAVSATTAIQQAGRYTAPLVADVEAIQSQLSEAEKVRKQKPTTPTATAATPTRKKKASTRKTAPSGLPSGSSAGP